MYIRVGLFLLVGIGCWISGCDKGTGVNPEDLTATIAGWVVDDIGFSKRQGGLEKVKIQAAELVSDGSLRVLGGETKSDAEGHYQLQTEPTPNVVVVRGERDLFRRTLLVDGGLPDGGTVQVGPMTIETSSETEVYFEVHALNTPEAEQTSVADVALRINSRAGLDIHERGVNRASVAEVIVRGVNTRHTFLRLSSTIFDTQLQVAIAARREAYRQYQKSMYEAGMDATKRAEAIERFERAAIEAYRNQGISGEQVALALHVEAEAIKFFANQKQVTGNTLLGLLQRAYLQFAWAATGEIEQLIVNQIPGNEVPDTLVAARQALRRGINTATASGGGISQAFAAYKTAVVQYLSTEGLLDQNQVDSLLTLLAEGPAAVLKGRLQASTPPEGFASAYVQYRSSAYQLLNQALAEQIDGSVYINLLLLLGLM